jgi:hypothetical protein
VAGLDRHRDRIVRAVPGLDQQVQQCGEPGRIVVDPTLGHQGAVLVDQRDVVMVLGPVDPAEHRHRSSPPVLVEDDHPGQGPAMAWGSSLLQVTRAP